MNYENDRRTVNIVSQRINGSPLLGGMLIIYKDNRTYTVTIKGYPDCTLF